jgi:hypothetical protein
MGCFHIATTLLMTVFPVQMHWVKDRGHILALPEALEGLQVASFCETLLSRLTVQ